MDVAALMAALVFGAFANAAGMIAPATRLEDHLVAATGLPSRAVTAGLLVAAVVLVPGLLISAAATVTRWTGRIGWRQAVGRFVPALVPIGFAMWFAHMFFHFVTGAGAIVPVVQRLSGVAQPAWGMAHSMSGPDWLIPAQITALGLGLSCSLPSRRR